MHPPLPRGIEKTLALVDAVDAALLDGILVTGDRLAAVRFNPRYVEMFGMAPSLEAPGRAHFAFISELMIDPDAFRARVGVIDENASTPAFDELRTKDGRVIERYATPIRTADGFAFRLWCFRDITERRRLDADRMIVSERMASMGRLLASVAHEINNPLAFVSANLEHMAETHGAAAASDFDELLADTRSGIEQIRVIVRDLRGLSRSDDECRESFGVERVMESALQMAMNEIRHRALLVRTYQSTPPVLANETRLGQVFLNLLVNAAHAMPEGQASLNKITVSTGVDEKGFVRIEVADTGCGVPAENVERIFEPFFTTKPVGSGTGLGLAICRGIVEGYGGTIHVEPVLGKGSRFVVRLPASPMTRTSIPASLAPPSNGPRVRILVVDDESRIRRAIVRALREHDVVTSEGVREAMTRIHAGERFDVILCDVMMPNLTGVDFHAMLAAAAPEQSSRVAFITGGVLNPATAAFLSRLKNERLDKPFSNAALRETVMRIAQGVESRLP